MPEFCSTQYVKIKTRYIIFLQQKAKVRILCFGFGKGVKKLGFESSTQTRYMTYILVSIAVSETISNFSAQNNSHCLC